MLLILLQYDVGLKNTFALLLIFVYILYAKYDIFNMRFVFFL